MPGSVFKRCGCVDDAGKPGWRSCPLLSHGTHGPWAYRVDLGPGIDSDGVFRRRRQRYRSGFTTKATAAAALSASVSQGSHVEASRLTVGVYLRQWLEAGHGPGQRPGSPTSATSSGTSSRCSAISSCVS